MPGTPATLSLVSPTSARTSTTRDGFTPNFSTTPGLVEPGAVLTRVVDANARAHELKEVLVDGDDRHVEAGRDGPRRHRADDVVSLIALHRENRHTERLAGFMDPVDLLSEIVGHRDAIGFVVRRDLVAEGRAGQVERGGEICRLVVGDELAQHRHEDVDGVCGLSFLIRQAAATKRVIRAVHLRAAIDQEERRTAHLLTISLP